MTHNQKIIAAICFSLLVLIMIGKITKKNTPPIPLDETSSRLATAIHTYENEPYGFSLEYPADWQINDLSFTVGDKKTISVQATSPSTKPFTYPDESVYIITIEAIDGNKTISSQGFYKWPFVKKDDVLVQIPYKGEDISITKPYLYAERIFNSFTFTQTNTPKTEELN